MSTTGYLIVAFVIVVVAIGGYAASLEARKRRLRTRLGELDSETRLAGD